MRQLTEHFTLEEFVVSATAGRLGIDNTPSEGVVGNLAITAQGLEAVRNLLGGKPIHVDSGYRCPELNTVLRGSKDSAHMTGFAADFTCEEAGTPLEIVRLINQSRIDFDQLIQEGSWVHISFAPAMRREVLTAQFGAQGTSYTTGVAA